MDLPVYNVTDLQTEILRLEKLRQQQKIDLKKRFSSPSAIFATAKTIFPSQPGDSPKNHVLGQDILGLISRVVLPFTLNKTLFKNSNFLTKTLVGMLSQKASTYVSSGAVGGAIEKVKGLFGKLEKKVKQPKAVVPPVAEPEPIVAPPVPHHKTITEGYPEPPKNY